MGIGWKDAECDWITLDIRKAFKNMRIKALMNRLIGTATMQQLARPGMKMDRIQAATLHDGFCYPRDPAMRNQLHIFSTPQARRCLKNTTVVVAGDSYNKHLFIGLADILLGRPNNKYQFKNAEKREQGVQEATRLLAQKFPNSTHLLWSPCVWECYGQLSDFGHLCGECLQNFTATGASDPKIKNMIPVVGAGIHIYSRTKSANRTLGELEDFFGEANEGWIFNSGPSYNLEKTPEEYREKSSRSEKVLYDGVLERLPEMLEDKVTYLDFFQLTRSCHFDNCTVDGGHRARFVNRWKAQVLLNTICEYRQS